MVSHHPLLAICLALIVGEAFAEPYTGREPHTVALYHFDDLIDGATLPNAAPDSRLRSRLRVPEDDRLGESLPGFGRALRMGTH